MFEAEVKKETRVVVRRRRSNVVRREMEVCPLSDFSTLQPQ
jgi:hypothetical protein